MKKKLLISTMALFFVSILSVFYLYYVDYSVLTYLYAFFGLGAMGLIYIQLPEGKKNLNLVINSFKDIKTYTLPENGLVLRHFTGVIIMAIIFSVFIFFIDNILRTLMN